VFGCSEGREGQVKMRRGKIVDSSLCGFWVVLFG